MVTLAPYDATRCFVCQQRPRTKGATTCRPCATREAHDKAAERQRREWWRPALRIITWKDMTVACMPVGRTGRFTMRACPDSVLKRVPRDKVLDLNLFQVGYDRGQVKRLKAGILGAWAVRK